MSFTSAILLFSNVLGKEKPDCRRFQFRSKIRNKKYKVPQFLGNATVFYILDIFL